MTTEKILYDIVLGNSENELFNGLIYSKGYVYASNYSIFAKVKYQLPNKSFKDKIVLKSGELIDINKSDFSKILYSVDDYSKNKERDTIDLNRIWDFVKLNKIFNEYADDSYLLLKIKDSVFSLNNLEKFLKITDELFLYYAGLSHRGNISAIVSKDMDNIIMLACCSNGSDFPTVDYNSGKISSELKNQLKEKMNLKILELNNNNNNNSEISKKEKDNMLKKINVQLKELEKY